MLCEKGRADILNSKDYLFQPKLDGTRALFINGDLINRRERKIRYRYPEFHDFKFERDSILDGEVIVYNDKGLPDFSLLQSREQTENDFKIELLSIKYPATYVVFDCLKYKGEIIVKRPIEERLEILKKTVKESKNLQIIYTSEKGEEMWNIIKKLGIEGLIAKEKGSWYYPGKRNDKWLKIKAINTIDCVIMGYTLGEGKREETFGALIIGAYKKDELIRLGKVGTGWTDQELKALKKMLDKYIIKKADKRVWLELKLVCEVEFLEMTEKGDLRAPSFKRLRLDKNPEDCIIEN